MHSLFGEENDEQNNANAHHCFFGKENLRTPADGCWGGATVSFRDRLGDVIG